MNTLTREGHNPVGRGAQENLLAASTCILAAWITTGLAAADIRLPHIFGSNMMRRRAMPLPAQNTGMPRPLQVADDNTITFDNVLVEEMWFCSGPSNVRMGTATCDNAQGEITAADYDKTILG